MELPLRNQSVAVVFNARGEEVETACEEGEEPARGCGGYDFEGYVGGGEGGAPEDCGGVFARMMGREREQEEGEGEGARVEWARGVRFR